MKRKFFDPGAERKFFDPGAERKFFDPGFLKDWPPLFSTTLNVGKPGKPPPAKHQAPLPAFGGVGTPQETPHLDIRAVQTHVSHQIKGL